MDNTCANCKKVFSSKHSLNIHIKTNTCLEKKNKKIFKCDYCDKILSTKQMLQYHLDSCEEKKMTDIKSHYESFIQNLKLENSMKEKEYQNKIINLEKKINFLLPNSHVNSEDITFPRTSMYSGNSITSNNTSSGNSITSNNTSSGNSITSNNTSSGTIDCRSIKTTDSLEIESYKNNI